MNDKTDRIENIDWKSGHETPRGRPRDEIFTEEFMKDVRAWVQHYVDKGKIPAGPITWFRRRETEADAEQREQIKLWSDWTDWRAT